VDKSWVDCDRATVMRRYDRLAKFIPLFDRLFFLFFSLWLRKHTMLGNPLIQPWRELAALCDDIEMRKNLFGSYYICRAIKPSIAPVAATEAVNGEAAIDPIYRIAAE
jgi:hypothetical protein